MAELLNVESALEMVGDDRDLLKELLEGYLNDRIFDSSKLEGLTNVKDENGNCTEAAKYVHYFKGAAKQLGAEILGEAGQALEDVLRGKKQGDLAELIKAFTDEYKRSTDEMRRYLDSFTQ
ncbi:MAG: Hpt domain-containing protein [Treponema sp.]|nr:Hpt domain-containing protein [Treponema sp.]MBR7080339.1 Hpt domain-containing protein [Treponema sp.]